MLLLNLPSGQTPHSSVANLQGMLWNLADGLAATVIHVFRGVLEGQMRLEGPPEGWSGSIAFGPDSRWTEGLNAVTDFAQNILEGDVYRLRVEPVEERHISWR